MTRKEQLVKALSHACHDEWMALQYSMPIKIDEKTIIGTEGHIIMYYQGAKKNMEGVEGVRDGSKLTVKEIEENKLDSNDVKEYTNRLARIIKYSKQIIYGEGVKYYEGAKVKDIYDAVIKHDYIKIDDIYFSGETIYEAIEALMMLGVKAVNIEKSRHDMITLKAHECGVLMVGLIGKPKKAYKVKTSTVKEADTEICFELGAEWIKKYEAEQERRRQEYERSKKIFMVEIVARSYVAVEAVTEEEAKELARTAGDAEDFSDATVETEEAECYGLIEYVNQAEVYGMSNRVITAKQNYSVREYFANINKRKSRT